MKLSLVYLLVCISSALVTACGASAGQNPGRLIDICIFTFCLISTIAMLSSKLSLDSALTVVLAGATGIAWGSGLLAAALFGSIFLLILTSADKLNDGRRHSWQVEVVCIQDHADTVFQLPGRITLHGFFKDQAQHQVCLILQAELGPKAFARWLASARSLPAVLDVRVKRHSIAYLD